MNRIQYNIPVKEKKKDSYLVKYYNVKFVFLSSINEFLIIDKKPYLSEMLTL